MFFYSYMGKWSHTNWLSLYICSWVKADKHWYVTSSVVSEGVRWFTGMSLSIYASDCGWIQCSIELECPLKSVKGHVRWFDDCIPICCLLDLDLHHIFVLNWIYIWLYCCWSNVAFLLFLKYRLLHKGTLPCHQTWLHGGTITPGSTIQST